MSKLAETCLLAAKAQAKLFFTLYKDTSFNIRREIKGALELPRQRGWEGRLWHNYKSHNLFTMSTQPQISRIF